jgi:hypothetical protein
MKDDSGTTPLDRSVRAVLADAFDVLAAWEVTLTAMDASVILHRAQRPTIVGNAWMIGPLHIGVPSGWAQVNFMFEPSAEATDGTMALVYGIVPSKLGEIGTMKVVRRWSLKQFDVAVARTAVGEIIKAAFPSLAVG